MKNKKIGIAILTSPLIFTLNVQGNSLLEKNTIIKPVSKDISPQALKKIDKIGNKAKDKAGKAWVELGEPWIEWSQEQKDTRRDQIKNIRPDKLNTIDTYNKILPKNGITRQKENIKIINP